MAKDDIVHEKSLLQCTIRKSKDVANKVVTALAILVAAIFGGFFAIAGIVGICEFAFPIVCAVTSAIADVLFAIPWWIYAVASAILAIPLYSLLWCLKRELKDEDYPKGSTGVFIAFGVAVVAILAAWTVTDLNGEHTDIGMLLTCDAIVAIAAGVYAALAYYGIAVGNCCKRLLWGAP